MRYKRERKVFFIWDYEREQAWINEQARQGWNLVRVGFCRYEFEYGEPGEYQYALQALEGTAGSAKQQDYLDFLEDMGVELIARFTYWGYFRRKSQDTPFEMYSDANSHIRHIRRIEYCLLPVLVLCLLDTFNVLNIYARDYAPDAPYMLFCTAFPFLAALLCGCIGLLVYAVVRLERTVSRLRQNRGWHE